MIDKEEFPPLLLPGFHAMTLAEIRAKCVTAFPLSKRRPAIMDGLEKFVAKLQKAKLTGDLWIDGSFITEKIEPDDVDIVLFAPSTIREQASLDQLLLIEQIEELAFKDDVYYCDTYITYHYGKDDQLYWIGEYMRAYWTTQYGFSQARGVQGVCGLGIEVSHG